MLNDLIYISTATLLPLIPAFVIYRTLSRYAPTTARVQGSPGLFRFLKGLKVDLQGAGASYFLLVFVIFGYIYTRPEPPHCVSYSVEGQIELRPKESLNPDAVAITVEPPQVNVVPNGVFKATVVLPDSADSLPTLLVSYPGHDNAPIVLDLTSHYATPNITMKNKRISIGDPVILTKRDENEPPYNP